MRLGQTPTRQDQSVPVPHLPPPAQITLVGLPCSVLGPRRHLVEMKPLLRNFPHVHWQQACSASGTQLQTPQAPPARLVTGWSCTHLVVRSVNRDYCKDFGLAKINALVHPCQWVWFDLSGPEKNNSQHVRLCPTNI